MVGTYPPHQLIGPLFALNGLLLAPLLPFVHWHLTWAVAGLHLASIAALVVGSWCVFELFVHGSASAVSIAQAMAPLPAVAFTALLLATPVTRLQTVSAAIVSIAVLAAVGRSFGRLATRHAAALVAAAAWASPRSTSRARASRRSSGSRSSGRGTSPLEHCRSCSRGRASRPDTSR